MGVLGDSDTQGCRSALGLKLHLASGFLLRWLKLTSVCLAQSHPWCMDFDAQGFWHRGLKLPSTSGFWCRGMRAPSVSGVLMKVFFC